MSAPGPQIDTATLDRLCESLRLNPSWEAAADYAGLNSRTLRAYRTRAEQYENRYIADDDPADLPARRLYHDARDAWGLPGARSMALSLLADLDRHLDRDHDRAYWLAVQRMNAARSRLEVRLHARLYEIATGQNESSANALKAIGMMLKWGWPTRYADRIELTGADGAALELQAANIEARAEAAWEQYRATRAIGE